MTHVIVDAGRIGPVGLGSNDAETLGFDEPLRDACSHAVELGCSVTGLTDQHDTRVADPMQERLEICFFELDEGLRMLGDEARQRHADGRARLHDTGRLGLPIAVFALPPFFADQRHESHIGDILALVLVVVHTRDADELLGSRISPNGHHHTGADLELAHERLWDIWRACRDEDRIEGSLVAPTLGAVRMAHMDVFAAGFGEVGRCSLGKLSDALDREDFAGNFRENGGGIAGTGTDLEQLFAAAEGQRLDHERNNIGLRDRLVGTYGKRGIVISFVPQALGDEQLPPHRFHGGKDEWIAHAPRLDLPGHEAIAALLHGGHR